MISPHELPRRNTDLPLEWTAYHDIMAEPCRRVCLEVLADVEGEISLAELASAIAARKDGPLETDRGAIGLQSELHHIHLPKLDEAGIVTYYTSSRIVELGEIDPA